MSADDRCANKACDRERDGERAFCRPCASAFLQGIHRGQSEEAATHEELRADLEQLRTDLQFVSEASRLLLRRHKQVIDIIVAEFELAIPDAAVPA